MTRFQHLTVARLELAFIGMFICANIWFAAGVISSGWRAVFCDGASIVMMLLARHFSNRVKEEAAREERLGEQL